MDCTERETEACRVYQTAESFQFVKRELTVGIKRNVRQSVHGDEQKNRQTLSTPFISSSAIVGSCSCSHRRCGWHHAMLNTTWHAIALVLVKVTLNHKVGVRLTHIDSPEPIRIFRLGKDFGVWFTWQDNGLLCHRKQNGMACSIKTFDKRNWNCRRFGTW